MPKSVTSGTNWERSWYRLSVHFDPEAMEALTVFADRLTKTHGVKVSLSKAIRIAVIDSEYVTRSTEEKTK